MLHKKHNSVVTLAILLTFVGVSKPAKAFLLAQSDAAPTTFAVPDRLAEDAEISIAASNSTNGITSSLNDSFAAKYPDAAVEIDVQDSGTALQNVVEGNVDLAAIGRSLTAQEKAQGLISVPISREKIAIVVSKNNPYDGNLTIGEFAQIFRGEITNWSEIGGASRAIRLVDLPDSNDTRTAFPNYPVFQSAEFTTGATAQQVQSDSTEAMIAELGDDGIGYAVANDVIGRDDVKIVTMHQTQPDDQRYPFSQPFSLVYQGTPSEAAQAYMGYAAGEGGQEIVADRVGSISTAAVTAIAPAVGAGLAGENGLDTADTATVPEDDAALETEATTDNPDGVVADAEDTELELDAEETDSADSTDAETEVAADNPDDVVADAEDTELELDAEGIDSADSTDVETEAAADNPEDVVADADVDTDVNPDLEDSGAVNSDLDGSGAVNPDLDGSGTVNSDLDGSGTVNSDLEESGTVNPDLDSSGEPLSSEGAEGEVVVPNETVEGAEGTEVAAKKGRWWLWLLPLLAIPLLVGAKAIFGGGAKSDREPALSNVPNINSPEGGISVPGMSGGGTPVGTNVNGGNLANMTEGAVGTTSRMGAAGLAAGGAALAGGAAAAANLAGKRGRVENQADADLDLELDLDETPTVEEIPSNPVTEFTEQETNLQTDDVDFDGIDSGESTMPTTDSAIAMGAAGIGAVATSGFTPSQTDDSETTDFDLDTSTEEPSSDQTTELTTPTLERTDEIEADPDSQVVSAEFRGDYVLPEETSAVLGGSNTVFDTARTDLDTDVDSGIDLDTDNISADVATPDVEIPDVDLPDVASPEANGETGILDGINRAGGAAIAGGAAAVGGAAAAASGLFNRGQDAVEDAADTSIDAPDVEVDANLDPNLDVDTTTPDLDIPTGIDAETNLDLPDSARGSDLNIDGVVGDVSADVNTPDVDLSLNTPEVELPDADLPSAEGGTGILDGINRAGGAAIAGGAAAVGGAAAAASGLFNRGQDAVEDAADTSIDAPDVEVDANLDTGLDVEANLGDRTNDIAANITGIEGEVAAPDLDISTGIEPGIDTGINPPDLAQNTDLNLGRVDLDEISGSVTTPDVNLPQVDLDSTVDGVTDSIATPDLDLPDINPPSAEGGTGIIDGVNRAGGAAIAGGAAALGGAAAAASGLFNRGQDAVEDAADTSIDAPDVDLNPNLETNLDVETSGDNPVNDIAADVSARVGDINTPDLDVSTGIDADVNLPESAQDTDLNLDLGGTVGNVSSNITTPEANLPTDVDISLDTPDLNLDSTLDSNLDLSSDPGNVAENATASNLDLSSLDLNLDEPTAESGTGIFEGVSRAGGAAALGGAAAAASGLFKSDEQSDSDIQEFETFETSFDLTADTTPTSFADNVVGDAETTSIEEVNIDDITLDNVADTAELNLEGMTLSDTDSRVDTSLEQITFDDAGEIDLDGITLDSSDQTDVSLEDIDFDGGTAALNLEEISFDDAEANLSSELDLNVSQTNESAEISLDDLGFEESEQADSFDLLGDNTAEITSFSDDQSNDMTNISEWLDSLETPNKDSDNIADWLDTLDKDSADSNPNSAPNSLDEDTNDNLTAEADDISFQFLEDLLDRDSDDNRNAQ